MEVETQIAVFWDLSDGGAAYGRNGTNLSDGGADYGQDGTNLSDGGAASWTTLWGNLY